MNINFSWNFCGNKRQKIWFIAWTWSLRKPYWGLYWKHKVCLSEDKLELEGELNMNNVHRTWTWTILATYVKIGEYKFEFELKNVYDSKLLLQPMWIWQTSWIRIITWMCNHKKSRWGLPSNNELFLSGLRWSNIEWDGPSLSEMVPGGLRWSQKVPDKLR